MSLCAQLTEFDDVVEARPLFELTHTDRVFDNRPLASHPDCVTKPRDRHYLYVQFGRPVLIQAEFLFAIMAPFFQRTKVEKAEIDRLFDLVGKVARQKYPGNVRFEEIDAADSMWIGSRGQQALNHHLPTCATRLNPR